ncbi:hypothetical protein C922_03717 [Plasmodium inui San Antonio 1]|uniref:Uncharacterized protein n=1 Tax=Plasmodium inui San Antonio 1 TaxID=1237626 RepID=W7A2T0_9APIC|nr:hypothetical protein C922_03717 [Plasmodium inui San Antonio 1]EUD65990.1 hypothetical protein C922_03717 [Plasmodium inui San Antonio 1]
MQILKGKKAQSKLNRGIDEKIEKAISAAMELYTLIEKQSENKNKKYLQKICSICDTLSHLLMRYNEDIVAELWQEELPTPRDGDIGGASAEDTLTEDEEPRKEKQPLTEREPQREETSGPLDGTQYREGEKNVKAAKDEGPHLERFPHSDILEDDFSTRNCIRCLYAADELNETEYFDPHRKIKPFRFFQLGDRNLALQNRKKLRKKFNRICRSKSYLLRQRGSNTSSADGSLSKGGMNNLSDLKRILLGINRTVTTFGTDNNGNINATIEFFTPYGGREKNIIHMNEYDYFFCSSSDESEVQDSTDGQPQDGKTQKKNPLFNRNNVFYVGNKKKVILNRKKKEKIIFQMDPNGILTKDIFIKGKNNENVLKKSFKENEWSDDHVDFSYMNEQKKKEKIVITKRTDGMCKRLFRDHELNGKQEFFDFYRRAIFNIREVHLYDDAEAMAFRILKRNQIGDQKNGEEANLGKKEKKCKGAERGKVGGSNRTPVHTNEWSLGKEKRCPGSSKENSMESIFSKLKRRKERYLKAIYLCSDKETGPIRKSQNLRRIKMHLNGGEGKKQPMGKRLTGKVPLAERVKAVHPFPPQMDSPLWESQIGKIKKTRRLRKAGADAPLRKCTGSFEKKSQMDKGEKVNRGETSKLAEKPKRGEKFKMNTHPLRGRFTEQERHPEDDSPKEDNTIKLGDDNMNLAYDNMRLGHNTMIYNKNENGYMNLYKEVKKGSGANEAVTVGTYSLGRLASIIEKSHAEADIPKNPSHQKTNKKIEEFVFNENLKDISITSHNVSRKSSKNCIKYHLSQGEIAQEENSHILNELNECREASGEGSHGPEKVQPNRYSNCNEADVIKSISTMSSKEDTKLDGESRPINMPSFRLANSPYATTHNNIFRKSSTSFGELAKSPSRDISKNSLGNLRDYVRRQLSDSQSDEMSHQLRHQLSSERSHQMSIGLKSDPEESEEEQNIANAAAVSVRREGDFPKGGLQEVNGSLEGEKKKRQQYLSRGFQAYAHIVLSESNVITRNCTVSFDYASKRVCIARNRKVFNIDVDKLYVQEIPTYEVGLGVVELVLSERRSRVLLLESRDLVGLQNLGDEIGWISTPNGKEQQRTVIQASRESDVPWDSPPLKLNTLWGRGTIKRRL